MASKVTVRTVDGAKFTQEIEIDSHRLIADEPTSFGGEDRGPGPYGFLLSALGACTAMTLRMYADRKGWPLEGADVELEHSRIHAEDCEDCETAKGKIDEIVTRVRLRGDLDETQRERLFEIAGKCPVHKTLTTETKIRVQPLD